MARITFTLEDGTEFEAELSSDTLAIGRAPDNQVVLASPSVSSHHAVLKQRGDAWFVQDLGATNGTKLNGVEVEEAKLEGGDRLSFGSVPAVFHLEAPALKRAADVPVPVAPPAAKPFGSPGQRAGVPRKPGAQRRKYSATYSESSGCAGFIAMLLFLTLAFLVGLGVRHYREYEGRFIITDAAQLFRDRFFGSDSESPAGGAAEAKKAGEKPDGESK